MSTWLIGGIAGIYLIVSVDLLTKGQLGLSLTFLGFALGNLGLCVTTLNGG